MLRIISGLLSDVTIGPLTFTTNELIMYCALCAVALILLVVVVILVVKRKKKKSVENNVATTATEAVDNIAIEATPEEQQANTNIPANKPTITVVVPQGQPLPKQTDSEDTDKVVRGRVQIIYNKSLTAKLCQADDEVKAYYDELKSELMSYKGVKNRISWKHECFRKGRVLLAKLRIRGKKLTIYLPLNPADYEDTKYKVTDVGNAKTNEDAPCAYMIKNDRRSRYAKELIAVSMANLGVEQGEVVLEKHSDSFPYDTTDSLIRRKLIKLVYSRAGDGAAIQYISAEEVNSLMTDEEAQQSVEEGTRIADRTKTGIVNVDVLSFNFEAGEKVTLEEMKNRIPGFNKKVTFVKVLARGVIDKPLTVEADDFSIDAVKMIVLTGGTVIRTKKQ